MPTRWLQARAGLDGADGNAGTYWLRECLGSGVSKDEFFVVLKSCVDEDLRAQEAQKDGNTGSVSGLRVSSVFCRLHPAPVSGDTGAGCNRQKTKEGTNKSVCPL